MRTLTVAAFSLALAAGGSLAFTNAPTAGDRSGHLAELAPRTGLRVEDDAPDAHLKNVKGEVVTIAELREEAAGPLVLVFYRGGWCPFCNKQLADLQKYREEIEATGATLIAISPESPEHIAETIEKIGADYTILSDYNNEAAHEYNLLFDVDDKTQQAYRGYGIALEEWNASEDWSLPVPAVYVIDREGKIAFAHADENYRKRLKTKKLIETLKDLQD